MYSTKLNEQIHVLLTCAFAFLIPSYYFILAPIVVLIGLNWLLNYKCILIGFKRIYSNKGLLALVTLYALYIIGLLYSTNLKFGGEVIETKMTFLLFPLIYSSYENVTKENINKYLLFFIAGTIVYASGSFLWASYSFFKPIYTDLYGVLYDLGPNYFYYSYLANYYHPSYTAMYSTFALISIFYLLYIKKINISWIWIFSILILCTYILLLSSKAGWITLFVSMSIAISWMFLSKKIFYALSLLIYTVSFFLLFNIFFTPTFSQRIPKVETITNAISEKDAEDKVIKTSDDGSARRIFVWKASFEVIKNNFLFGVGTGDTKDEMLKMYEKKGMLAELNAKLNSHNQFLNTSVSIGFIGLIALLFCFLIPFYYSFKQKQFVFYGFIVIVFINLLFESMFEKQAGVLFYAFFYTLLSLTFFSKNNSPFKL